MGKLIQLKFWQQFDAKAVAVKGDGYPWLSSSSKSNTGFTLIEVVVVVLIIGILAAIATPSWLALVNRKQINAANDAVLRALRDAQREAKRTKLSYNVSFISVNQNQVPPVPIVPQVAISLGTTPPPLSSPLWKNLGQNIALKPGQVLLYTNIDPNSANNVASPNSLSLPKSSNPTTITFDYMGNLPKANFGSSSLGSAVPPGLKVVVAQAQPGTSLLGSNVVKRCVIVQTLIGGMQTAKDSNCN